MYIFVDNRPWLRDLGSRGAHFWQLMVTKVDKHTPIIWSNFLLGFVLEYKLIVFVYLQSRLSPFAYSKNRREKKEGKEVSSQPSTSKPKNLFSVIEAVASSRKRVLLPVKHIRNSLQLSSELHRTLHGFIVFEVAWNNVRGINYFNELQVLQSLWQACYFFSLLSVLLFIDFSFIFQTDTSLAIEAKLMKRWEFDNIAQAASCMSSWFSGTLSEQLLLKGRLESASGGNRYSYHCFHVNVHITSKFRIVFVRSI